MIVVVEGPSAAGKSTWAASHRQPVVAENGHLAPPAEHDDARAFWVLANCERWRQAIAMETQFGMAICDTDPFKLHYDFCLLRVGRLDPTRFRLSLTEYRNRLEAKALGIADLVICAVPDAAVNGQLAVPAGGQRKSPPRVSG